MIKNIMKTLRPSRDAVADALLVVDQLREQNSEKRAELRQITEAPQPVTEALAAYDAWAAAAATDAIDALHLGKFLNRSSANDGLKLPFFPNKVGDGVAVDSSRATEIVLALLVATQGAALRTIIAGQLADMTAGQTTLTSDERVKKQARASAEILELELHEERAVRDLEANGVAIARRSDADPRAVLAADASLPS